MATNSNIALPNLRLDAQTRAAEISEQNSVPFTQRIKKAWSEIWEGHGENYFDGF
jgi:hypothetical protein